MADPVELADSVSPNSSGFNNQGGRATWTYQLRGSEVEARALEILGYTDDGKDGRLKRVLPRSAPQFRWLYANAVNLRGVGRPTDEDAEAGIETDPVVDLYSLYPTYDCEVEFTHRPYALLPDAAIAVNRGEYFDEHGQTVRFRYATEWERYTDWVVTPAPELITAQQGHMVFKTGEFIGPNNDTPDDAAGNGLPRMQIGKSLLTVTWYQVPYRYVESENSYLDRFLWKINQNRWCDFDPGYLLYENYEVVNRSTPPFPDKVPSALGANFSTEKVCDIKLYFRIFRKEMATPYVPKNGNWIAAGHNLFPWFGKPNSTGGREFYYVVSINQTDKDDEFLWQPTYTSFPVEILFTDPDVNTLP